MDGEDPQGYCLGLGAPALWTLLQWKKPKKGKCSGGLEVYKIISGTRWSKIVRNAPHGDL